MPGWSASKVDLSSAVNLDPSGRPAPTPTAPPPPPTVTDFLEKLLLKIVIFGVILLAIFLGVMAYLARKHPQQFVASPPATTTPALAAAQQASSGVALTIDFGDGSQLRYPSLPHSPGMSVVDAMNLTKGLKRPIAFEFTGTGDMTLITAIGGLANEGGGTGARNWQFLVNDRPGTVSAAISKLNVGDRVTWIFRPYSPPQP